jgi:putative membrane-bound dehydrogenase-like protein
MVIRAAVWICTLGALSSASLAEADDETYLFTPAGFTSAGVPATASGENVGRLEIVVRDQATGKPTFCRINVVGPEGQYYQPPENRLTPFSLTGEWPKTGKGNRPDKAPIRYYGRFFYSAGECMVAVPPGAVRVEVWKGFEYRPQSLTTRVKAGTTHRVELALTRTLPVSDFGYQGGDAHIHIKRETEEDDQLIFDLMEAEDIRFGSILAYNEPAGPYHGVIERMDSRQLRGLGPESIRKRGGYAILSGQEYRSGKYGHLNLFLRTGLALPGQSVNADNWPLYGQIGRETLDAGGYAFYAHGGYAQSIYADAVQGNVSGVELLQFGVYRGIELGDWYRMLNCGLRFPCLGASDYPACRALGDCRTYVRMQEAGGFPEWLKAASQGASFVTTGPMLLLEIDELPPGSIVSKNGAGPHRVQVHARVISEVAPVTSLQLIVNGKVAQELTVATALGQWLDLSQSIELTESSWIAARAFSKSPSGSPDGEAHTNPAYVYLDAKAPYNRADLDVLVERIDGQMAIHRAREFAEKSRVLDYFQKSRDILLKIRERGGLPAEGVSAVLSKADPTELANPGTRIHSDAELKSFLKPLPPKTPKEALQSFETVDGFRMELVASEPLVASPVAAAFDENGNLYVAEMRDYPFRPKPGQKPLGTVRLLRDTDGDGRFDEADVFADELLWAAGIAPWKGGVFVAAPPDIWYLKDTNGDHKADVRRKVFTGFGTQNQQGMLNNLTYGLDHKVYGSTSSNGGLIRPGDKPDAPGISVRGRDFRFDPATEKLETITGTLQFGNTFDDWGIRFLCSESQPLLQPVLPQHYLARNPYLAVPTAIQNIAGGSVPIFRISPIERWRQIRSSRRIAHNERSASSAGASHHVVDAGAGVTVYRGGAYPERYYGTIFLGDAQNNLIHHRALTADGPTFQSRRVEERTEFVRSSDNWFRPVNLLNAPDGTLYVLDMSREILESIHIPLDVVKYLDLKSGRNQGRIYRIAPPGFQPPRPPRLGSVSTAELVAALESPHGWCRDTAHRLLHERQDPSAIEPLRTLIARSALPQARLLAFWSLAGLNALDGRDLLAGLSDAAPGVREQAVRLSEPRIERSSEIFKRLLELVHDENPRVRFQLAFTLGETRDPRAVAALAALAKKDAANPWHRAAILSSCPNSASAVLAELLSDPAFLQTTGSDELVDSLGIVVGARNQRAEINGLLNLLASSGSSRGAATYQEKVLRGLGRGLKQAGTRLATAATPMTPAERFIADRMTHARAVTLDAQAPETSRQDAIALLGCLAYRETRDTLASLLDPAQPHGVQRASLKALADYNEPEVASLLLSHFSQLGPALRSAAVEALLARETWTLRLLSAAQRGEVPFNQIEPARRPALLQHRNSQIAQLAKAVFAGATASSRKDVLADYATVLTLPGDAKRGSQIFLKHCAACHRLGDQGYAVGPELTSSPARDSSALLAHILDPNQYVLPNYVQYLVTDRDGRVYSGLIAAETATAITLRRGENAQDTILRSQIEESVSTGASLMPEGFERLIPKPEMADLLAFLLSHAGRGVAAEAPLDRGTDPGVLIEPDR